MLKENRLREKFSTVLTHDGLVTGFGGMPASDNVDEKPPLMFTGIHIMEPRIFDYIPRGVPSDSVIDVYPKAMARGERVAAHVADGIWYELSTIQRYLEISLIMLAREGKDRVMGKNCLIDANATVHDSVLWDNVSVATGACVRRSILGDSVMIGPGELIEDCAIVRAELVEGQTPPKKALKGEVRGENFVVPLGR